MRKTTLTLWTVFSTAMTLFGVPGVVDNWKSWKALAAKLAPFMSPEWFRSGCLAIGLISLAGLLVYEIRLRRKGESPRKAAAFPASWNDPEAVAKRQEQMTRVVAAAENAKHIAREESERPHLKRVAQNLRSAAEFPFADVLEAQLRTASEEKAAAETPKGRRDAALKLGGLEGAKALIEIEIDSIPTYPSGHESGEWEKWIERMDALLSELFVGSVRGRFVKRIESIKRDDNSRPVAIYHLRALLNNLTEDDLRVARTSKSRTEPTTPDDPAPIITIDPVPVRGWRGWRIRVINNSQVTITATLEIVDSKPKFSDPRLSGTPRLRVSETSLSTIDISGKGHRFFDFCKIEETCILIYARYDGPGGMDSYGAVGTDYEITLRAFAPNGRPDERRFRTMRHEDGRDEVRLA